MAQKFSALYVPPVTIATGSSQRNEASRGVSVHSAILNRSNATTASATRATTKLIASAISNKRDAVRWLWGKGIASSYRRLEMTNKTPISAENTANTPKASGDRK